MVVLVRLAGKLTVELSMQEHSKVWKCGAWGVEGRIYMPLSPPKERLGCVGVLTGVGRGKIYKPLSPPKERLGCVGKLPH